MAELGEGNAVLGEAFKTTVCALIDAAQCGDSAKLQQILADNAEAGLPNMVDDRYSMPALHWACASDEAECARLLLSDSRTDRSAVSSHGMTAMHVAASSNSLRALTLLISDGFALESINEWGETPLHVAATSGSQAAVAALLAAGANTMARDKWGRNASAVAKQQGLDPNTLGLPAVAPAEEAAQVATEVAHVDLLGDALRIDLANALAARRDRSKGSGQTVVEKGMFAPLPPRQSPPAPLSTSVPVPPPPPPPRPPPLPSPTKVIAQTASLGMGPRGGHAVDLQAAVRARAERRECVEPAAVSEQMEASHPMSTHVKGDTTSSLATPTTAPATSPAQQTVRLPGLSKFVEFPGDADAITSRLAAGTVDPAGRDLYGLSALDKFVAWDKPDLCRLLLPHLTSADVNAPGGPEKWTPLQRAADMGAGRALACLLERRAAGELHLDMAASDGQGRSAYSIAVERGHSEMVAMLEAAAALTIADSA